MTARHNDTHTPTSPTGVFLKLSADEFQDLADLSMLDGSGIQTYIRKVIDRHLNGIRPLLRDMHEKTREFEEENQELGPITAADWLRDVGVRLRVAWNAFNFPHVIKRG